MAEVIARLNAALEGRYRLVQQLGEGGTATVYLAQDLRHERRVALKVLKPEIAERVGQQRFLAEIRTTANLQHPHILPLFDSGEADGFLFYVMPYVEGETLRERIAREGALEVGEAVRIARVVAGALQHAHDRGIVHRDIKPANILLQKGDPLIADFGIALAVGAGGTRLTASGLSMGTPQYMSPEQISGDPPVGPRTDVYALGCLLFEMLAGEPPFSGKTARSVLVRQMVESSPDLGRLRDGVSPSIAAVVRQSLSKQPADRQATVSDFADALTAGGGAGVPRKSRGWFGKPVTWAASVTVAAALAISLSGSQAVPFEKRDWILITDFVNRTGDTLFDGLLERPFAVGLRQSRYFNVFPQSRVAEVLTYMGRDPSASLDEELALEVALRMGLQAVVSPVIDDLGARYVITANVLDPDQRDVVASRSVQAGEREHVLRSLDELANELRRDLGEPLLSRLRDGVRLDRATTSSLEALRAWTSGNQQWHAARTDAAAALYERAVELDPGFAMAHADLGVYHYAWRNDRARGDPHFDAALQLVDRVTRRERNIIEARVAGFRGDGARAVDIYNVHLADYPDDQVSWSNLGYELLRLSRLDAAAEAYDRALELDSLDATSLLNLATVHSAAGRAEASVPVYQRAFALNSGFLQNANIVHEYGVALADLGRFQEAEEAYGGLLAGDRGLQSRARRSLALLRMRRGRYAEAVDHLRQAVLLSETGSQPTTVLRNRALLSAALLKSQGPDPAHTELLPVLAIVDSAYIAPFFLGSVGTLFARMGDLERAHLIADSAAARAGESNDFDQAALQHLRGHIALAEGSAESALDHFQRSAILNPQISMLYLGSLVEAQMLLGNTGEARGTLEQMVAGRSGGREGQERWIEAHYHLARLADDEGDTAEAIQWYDRFLEIWDQADEGLAPVPEARRRLGALRVSSREP